MTRVGVLGGGQLGRMLALAGVPLGLDFVVLDPAPDAPAGKVAEPIVAPYDDARALDEMASRCSIATFEFENVPVTAVRRLLATISVHPSPDALVAAQDRLTEKTLFRSLGLQTAPFRPVDDGPGLRRALAEIGVPAILKTRREGYDGKGQTVLRSEDDADEALEGLAGRPLILEGLIPFERELSILAVRSARGQVAFYPLVENHHREGILRLSRAPAPAMPGAVQAQAEREARRLLEKLDYVGVLAIEYFLLEGRLFANEMAPRVHNSGHWTIEGAVTSQFENHLRAILGWPLGATAATGSAAMVNLVGELPDVNGLLDVPSAHVHLYGKRPRPGRKLGHVTITAAEEAGLASSLSRLAGLVREPVLREWTTSA